jgi:hypothetical protein
MHAVQEQTLGQTVERCTRVGQGIVEISSHAPEVSVLYL